MYKYYVLTQYLSLVSDKNTKKCKQSKIKCREVYNCKYNKVKPAQG